MTLGAFLRWPFRRPHGIRPGAGQRLVCGECYAVVLREDKERHARWHLGDMARPMNPSHRDGRQIEWVDVPERERPTRTEASAW